ncbi:hypothetical protein WGR79_08275 [Klebsiella pneumoniae]|uniref:hypothetical protein n=1 Tax=Klebsiella pneumoniae TaxID=573 RepID=UPI0037C0742E
MGSNNKLIKIMYILIILFSWTSIFSLIAVKTDSQIVKLWKEIAVIAFYILSIMYLFRTKKIGAKKVLISIVIPVYIFVFYILTSMEDNRILVFYQFKTDIIPFLFPFAMYCIIETQEQAHKIYRGLCNVFIFIGITNAIFVFIERIFTTWFLVFLEIDNLNNQSGKSGLRLDNTSDGLRAMGTMTSFINSGTLMILSIFILLESGIFNKKKKILLLPLFIAGAIATTYKTAMVTLLLYLPIKIIFILIKTNGAKKMFLAIYTLLCFSIMGAVFNSSYLYDKFKNTSLHKAAYSSIYVRVLQHDDILADVEKESLLTGVGVGVNGTQGPPELKYSSKALDSTYVNLLSNYGLLGLSFYLLFFLFLMFKNIFMGVGDLLASFLIFFHIGIEFFANNILMNFPLNIYISIFLFFSLFYRKKDDV